MVVMVGQKINMGYIYSISPQNIAKNSTNKYTQKQSPSIHINYTA